MEPQRDSNLNLRMVVGVDERGLALPAIERALELAQQYADPSLPLSSRVRLVHAVRVPPPLWPGLSEKELSLMHGQALNRSREAVIETVRPLFREVGLDVKALEDVLRVVPGRPADALLRHGEEMGANLLLLGPHGERAFMDFGSTARAVLAKAQAPIWNQFEAPKDVDRILVPVDFSECSEHALDYACSLAQVMEASVRVMHCMELGSFAMSVSPKEPIYPTYVIDSERKHTREALHKLVDEHDWGGVKHESVFHEGEVREAILQEAEKADLVVMGKRGHSRLSRFLLGNVAYSVLKRASVPVLVLPEVRQPWFGEGRLEPAPVGAL